MKSRISVTIFLIITLALHTKAKTGMLNTLAFKDELEIGLSEMNEEMVKQLTKEMEPSQTQKEQLEQLLSRTQYECIGGRRPSSLSKKNYLKYFSEGPCNPTVFLPGITGSKLMIQIDCPVFKESDPDTFKACGWLDCKYYRPSEEYRIWIPKIDTPMSIFKTSDARRRCLAGVFGLNYEKAPDGSYKNVDKPGLKIVPMGTSPETRTDGSVSQCGFTGIEEMLPFLINLPGYHYFKYMKEAFLNAGYMIGLTMQALPYDWRKHQRETLLSGKFHKVVENMSSMVGKKVVIVAHSYGNYQAVNFLWSLNQQQKDQMIARYIALAPPYGGAVKPPMSFIGFDSGYSYNLVLAKVGLTEVFFEKAGYAFKGGMTLFPKNQFGLNKDKDFIKAIQGRIQAEKEGRSQQKGTVMDIFPSPTETCLVGFSDRSPKCVLGLHDFAQNFGSINGESLTYDNIYDLLKKYSYNDIIPELYKSSIDERLERMDNLGVQVNILFSGAIPTLSKIEYLNNPRYSTSKSKTYDPDHKQYSMGDGSVLTPSALVAGIKWASDFKSNKENAKPVVFVELCGEVNQRTSIFDANKTVKDNFYMGINCSCKGTSSNKESGSKCAEHQSMIEEPNLISFVLDSAIDGVKGKVGDWWDQKTESYYADFVSKCFLYN